MDAPAPHIVSGAQTGADRAGLDWALFHDLPCGGWCPRGRRAEDGVIPASYQLKETRSEEYKQSTLANVRDSDATIIFSVGESLARNGAEWLEALSEPLLHLSHEAHSTEDLASKLCAFLAENRVRVLNVAGPRASEEPGLEPLVDAVLSAALGSREVVRSALLPRTVAQR